MQVPTLEQFEALQQRFEAMERKLNQIMSAKVSVEWVGIDVAEILLSCSSRTIYRLIKRNELSASKTGKRTHIGLNSIRAYLLKNKYEPVVIEARISSLLAA